MGGGRGGLVSRGGVGARDGVFGCGRRRPLDGAGARHVGVKGGGAVSAISGRGGEGPARPSVTAAEPVAVLSAVVGVAPSLTAAPVPVVESSFTVTSLRSPNVGLMTLVK